MALAVCVCVTLRQSFVSPLAIGLVCLLLDHLMQYSLFKYTDKFKHFEKKKNSSIASI